MLPRRTRLSKETEIKEVLRQKQYQQKHPLLFLVAKDSACDNARLVVVTPKRLGKATVRNRLRRIIAAAFAEILPAFKKRIDIVAFPSSRLIGLGASDAKVALTSCLKRIHVL